MYLQSAVVKDLQNRLGFLKKFSIVSDDLKVGAEQGFELYEHKDNTIWINPKAKSKSRNLNFYSFNDVDFSELNMLLNEIYERETRMRREGYNLDGIKSFNKNIWLDLSRESNAIEGIFEDFSEDLLDFRVKLNGQFTKDPSTANFDKYDYFKKLWELEDEIKENNDSVVIRGRNREHRLSLNTVRHFIAFKYIYECAKKDMNIRDKVTKEEFNNMLHYAATLLSGGRNIVSFRNDPARVYGADWIPCIPDKLNDKIDALCGFVVDQKQNKGVHPIVLAAMFHAEFIRIHPLSDGNGRTARIMTNYILMNHEMPTIAVRYSKLGKQAYFDAINKAVESHDLDDLIGIFYEASLSRAKKIDECLNYIEKKQKSKVSGRFEKPNEIKTK